ncbi:mitochondrial FAD carrier protein flx1 [Coemansia spiralis]|uniref:Mitochondrial FAD carrier protein flx1 n=2 Tax=Coemansia TaxID=4863 RepID=A0A9W8KYV1_9FUNG|nr:mitochondrial FAD carrier protein [Coemansia spiralis]KAJ1993111.1 mitochondrial FAD carrier protein flx1 [Coemansia umbellata]KAJ2623773.1 mitochondrial FAD carrier protein flx1 [Coemansia sp. RSA 1358]KAJ2677722.1 mitochondrial FAD carrier protein flx1 [Coemansia spiralis]
MQQQKTPQLAGSFSGSLAFDHALAGVGGAIVSTTAMHPLDLIKIRLQVDIASQDEAILGRAVRATRHVLSTDGISGLYRGLSANLAGNCASWGLYFAWYTWIKDQMAGGHSAETTSGTSTLSPGHHLIAGAMAGALTQFMANPLWVVKTRICTTSRGDPASYRGLIDGLTQISKKEGIRGLYKGLAPGLLGVAHGGLQFMAYEEMKKQRLRRRQRSAEKELTSADFALMSSASKVFALAITYPSQVLRSRLQHLPGETISSVAGAPRMASYSGLGDVITKTVRSEGITGFYKGFGPALLRILPGNILTFLVYEKIAGFFRRHASISA